MPSPLVVGGALANCAHEVSEDDLVAFLLEPQTSQSSTGGARLWQPHQT